MRTSRTLAALVLLTVLGPGPRATAMPQWPSRTSARLNVQPAAAVRSHDATPPGVPSARPDPLPERFLSAHKDLERGRHEAAAEAFEKLAAEWPALRDVALFFSGQAWLSAKAPLRAVAVLEQVSEASHRHLDALRLLSRADEELGDFARAAGRLEPLTRPDSTHPAHLRIAALRRAAELSRRGGDAQTARALRLRLWSSFPTSPSAQWAIRGIKASSIPALSRAERADALAGAYRPAEARAEARRALARAKVPDEAACLANLVNAKLLRSERRNRAVVATLEPLLEACTQEALRPRVLYLLATSKGILDAEAGRALWTRLADEYPLHSYADDALYAAAELDLKLGDAAGALERLDTLVRTHPHGDYAGEAHFRRFFIRWRGGDLGGARSALERFEEATRGVALALERPRALYWSARFREAGGDEAAAHALYGEVLRHHPTTIYALWAEERLGDRAGELTVRAEAGVEGEGLAALERDAAWRTARALQRLGLAQEAERAFAHVDVTAHGSTTLLAAAHVLRAEGQAKVFRSLPERAVEEALIGPLNGLSQSIWDRHRPQSYASLLDDAAARAGVEADLLRGLVHRESRFNPRARSGAGALGLAQVMPATAREELRRLGGALRDPSQLLEPKLNARVGASYLARLLRQFDGRAELALAAYNGGPGRVSRWWSERTTDEVDVFVESIPIEETRQYVKNVMQSAAAYRALRQSALLASSERAPRG